MINKRKKLNKGGGGPNNHSISNFFFKKREHLLLKWSSKFGMEKIINCKNVYMLQWDNISIYIYILSPKETNIPSHCNTRNNNHACTTSKLHIITSFLGVITRNLNKIIVSLHKQKDYSIWYPNSSLVH